MPRGHWPHRRFTIRAGAHAVIGGVKARGSRAPQRLTAGLEAVRRRPARRAAGVRRAVGTGLTGRVHFVAALRHALTRRLPRRVQALAQVATAPRDALWVFRARRHWWLAVGTQLDAAHQVTATLGERVLQRVEAGLQARAERVACALAIVSGGIRFACGARRVGLVAARLLRTRAKLRARRVDAIVIRLAALLHTLPFFEWTG